MVLAFCTELAVVVEGDGLIWEDDPPHAGTQECRKETARADCLFMLEPRGLRMRV